MKLQTVVSAVSSDMVSGSLRYGTLTGPKVPAVEPGSSVAPQAIMPFVRLLAAPAVFATPYAARVGQMLGGAGLARLAQPRPPTLLSKLTDAWRATLDGGGPAAETATENDWHALLRAQSRSAGTKLSP